MDLPKPPQWAESALCTETYADVFFPGRNDVAAIVEAKEICKLCPVQKECLDYAIAIEPTHGIWAGRSGALISKMARRRKRIPRT